MKAPSTALLRTFSPLWQTPATSWTARACAQQQPQCANFSSTRSNMARKGRGGEKRDMRISESSSLSGKSIPPPIARAMEIATPRRTQSQLTSHLPHSPDPVPPATPTDSTTPPLLPVKSPSHTQLRWPRPPATVDRTTNPPNHTATGPSATGPSTAPGASTNPACTPRANLSWNDNTTAWPPHAKLCA